MKKIFKSLVVGVVISLVFSLVPFASACQDINEKVFRVHILANSDSSEDQNLKLMVRDSVIKFSEGLLSECHSKEEAMETVNENLAEIQSVAQNTVYNLGYDYPVKLSVQNMYFNTRYYDEITMPAGYYDALRIEIGKARGKNWWCVMYPSLCLYSECKSDKLEENLSDSQFKIVSSKGRFEFRFKLLEVFTELFTN